MNSATLIAALAVRRTVEAARETAWYLVLALRYRRPLPAATEIARFLYRALRSSLTRASLTSRVSFNPGHTTGWSGGPPLADATGLSADRTTIAIRNPPVRPPGLLADTRAHHLQQAILRRVFLLECDISLPREDAETLGRYSSAAWVRHNLLTAAGCGAGCSIPAGELKERCRVVLPVVLNSLRMHQTYLAGNDNATASGTEGPHRQLPRSTHRRLLRWPHRRLPRSTHRRLLRWPHRRLPRSTHRRLLRWPHRRSHQRSHQRSHRRSHQRSHRQLPRSTHRRLRSFLQHICAARRVRVLQRRYSIGPHGEIRGSLYPRQIPRERRRRRQESLRETTAHRYRVARTTSGADRFKRYLAAVSLVVTADLRDTRRAERILNALHRVVEHQQDSRRTL